MYLILIAVWFLALGLIIYLAVELAAYRLSERRERKAVARRLSKPEKYSRRERTREVDDAGESSGAVGSAFFRHGFTIFGLIVLILWELFGGSELAKAPDPSQIPFFFLFLMMSQLPLVSRGILLRS